MEKKPLDLAIERLRATLIADLRVLVRTFTKHLLHAALMECKDKKIPFP